MTARDDTSERESRRTDGGETGGAPPTAAVSQGLAAAAGKRYAWGMLVVVLGGSLVAIAVRDASLLNFVHVLLGATWIGATIYLVAVLGPVMGALPPESRGAVVTNLVPKALFFVPAIAVGALVTGIPLAVQLNLTLSSTRVLLGIAVGVLLLVFGSAIAVIQYRMYQELTSPPPDVDRMERLAARNVQVGVVLLVLQVVVVAVMTSIRFGL